MSEAKSKIIVNRQDGQMAIFVALIFQILFVFFAMAINVGLVVHDKINLQNAVDIAAFYAGQRQAEWLNVIAHTNYQIHQSWKLLNWRYYVVGTLAMESPPHPTTPGARYPHEEKIWPFLADEAPALCVTRKKNWISMPDNDNPCKSPQFSVRNIEIPPVIAGWIFGNVLFNQLAKKINAQISKTCNGYSGYNWYYAASIYYAYIMDQKSRKELIRGIANNLASEPKKIFDLDGDTIYDGTLKTLRKNLTVTNSSTLNPEDFELINSLEGIPRSKWLNEVDVWFTLFYQDLFGNSSNCSSKSQSITVGPQAGFGQVAVDLGEPNTNSLDLLLNNVQQSRYIPAGNPGRMSIGVEKNPWYMAYMGVRAKTKPRQLFFPFGEPLELKAEAFAKPFGGAIGPWHGIHWSREALESGGDPIGLAPQKLQGNGNIDMNDKKGLVPQYSKYPGDLFGMQSILAHVSLNNTFVGLQTHMRDYTEMTKEFGATNTNDILAFPSVKESNMRNYELAAIAPDLFDAAYYSIQPNFGRRYLKKLVALKDRLGLSKTAFPRSDLGSRGQEGDLQLFSVEDQMDVAFGVNQKTGMLHSPEAFWFLKAPAHMLTSWVHNDTNGDYTTFPENRFGRCDKDDRKLKLRAPGGCINYGGRSGYSVKLISPEIFTASIRYGGSNQGAGVILNPPPEK